MCYENSSAVFTAIVCIFFISAIGVIVFSMRRFERFTKTASGVWLTRLGITDACLVTALLASPRLFC